jgi:hypothetical protein
VVSDCDLVAIRKFKVGLVPFKGCCSPFCVFEECLRAEETNLQVKKIVPFALQDGDPSSIVDDFMSNDPFLGENELSCNSCHPKRYIKIDHQGPWNEVVGDVGTNTLEASGVNDELKVVVLSEETAGRCLKDCLEPSVVTRLEAVGHEKSAGTAILANLLLESAVGLQVKCRLRRPAGQGEGASWKGRSTYLFG